MLTHGSGLVYIKYGATIRVVRGSPVVKHQTDNTLLSKSSLEKDEVAKRNDVHSLKLLQKHSYNLC